MYEFKHIGRKIKGHRICTPFPNQTPVDFDRQEFRFELFIIHHKGYII